MSYSRLILKDRPDIVWPLDRIDDTSSSSNPINFITRSASSYSASINTSVSNVLEIPILFSGGPALRLSSTSTAGLSIPLLGRFSEIYSNKEYSLEFWMKADKVPSSEIVLGKKRNFDNVGLFLKENYLMYRYGNSSSYIECSYGLADLSSPTHVVMNYSRFGIELIINGVSNSVNNSSNIKLEYDASHTTNDFFDFYGHPSCNIVFDCIAIYPYQIKEIEAKKHYMYGIGKDFDSSIIFSMGGDFYNFSNNSTRKSFFAYWDFPEEWQLARYNNLIHMDSGITTKTFADPEFYSYDNNITTTDNKIRFYKTSTGANTYGTYIDINNISEIVDTDTLAFFAKVKLDGTPPELGGSQTIISYSKDPLKELINFNLKNVNNSYRIYVDDMVTSLSSSFSIQDITSSPTVYIGYGYLDKSNTFFAEEGGSLQTGSFSYLDIDGVGTDPMQEEYPPREYHSLRIGSRNNYNLSSDISTQKDIDQFNGTFIKFLTLNKDASISTYNDINNYEKYPYSLIWDSNKNKINISSYGNMNFILHGTQIADIKLTGSAIISSNKLAFGYPDIDSGGQVSIYATLYDYNDNVINAKTQLSSTNHIEWINLVDLSDRYLLIDLDINSYDTVKYRPFIKYFYMETYPFSGSYTEIQDDGGKNIKLYSNSDGLIKLPEISKTPTIVMNKDSGISLYRSIADMSFSPIEKPLNINSRPDVGLWLEARSINGFNILSGNDTTVVSSWKDLSTNNITSTVTPVSASPEYRIQSLNLLRNNHSNGSEDGTTDGIIAVNSTVSSDILGAVSGDRSFKITPDTVSNNSYISINVASAIYPNQQYTLVADITINKSQESTDLHARSRAIGILETPLKGTYSTNAINQIGTQSLSVTFTTQSNMTNAFVMLYNGSASSSDVIYYDNIGLYSGSSVSGSPIRWYYPHEHYNDREIVRFSSSITINEAFTASQGLTLYMVARSFGDGGLIGGDTASAPSLYVDSGSFTMSAGQIIVGPSNNNDYNLVVGVFNGISSSFFINGLGYSGNAGTGSYSPNELKLGRSIVGVSSSYFLNGGIASLVIFKSAHSKSTIDLISEYMRDEFNV